MEMKRESLGHLVLDLDGTLVHTVAIDEIVGLQPGEEHPESPTSKLLLNGKEHILFGRPYIREFLRFCFENFESVSVWTAGTQKYAEHVVETLFETRPKLLWTRKDCMLKGNCHIKPLSQMAVALGAELATVRVLDDNVMTFCLNRERALYIKSWSFSETQDKHLLRLIVAWELRSRGDSDQAFWIEHSVAE